MNIKLYEYGVEQSLDTATRILRSALGAKLSKNEKDLRIREVVGIIDTLQRVMLVDYEDEVNEND